MTLVGAWIMQVTGTHRAALGVRDLLHIVPEPATHPIPRAPAHCRAVLRWEGRILPVVDLAVLLGGASPQSSHKFVGVLGYYTGSQSGVQFGGIALDNLPTKLELAGASGCALPEDLMHWRPYVNACFDHEGPVPVIHVPSLFKPLT